MTETLVTKLKLMTGHCKNGWHEGSNPVTFSGGSAPTCKMFLTCPCFCHAQYDEMFAAAELPRILVNNSAYRVDNPFWMPTAEERAAFRLEALKEREEVEIREATNEHSPSIVVRTFSSTPTGRTARGQLEQCVLLATTRWTESPGDDCDIKWIIANVKEFDGVDLPSTGAVHACLKRWMEIGFAMAGGKPFQFYGFTPDGKKLGLEAMKQRSKDKEKLEARKDAHRVPSLKKRPARG